MGSHLIFKMFTLQLYFACSVSYNSWLVKREERETSLLDDLEPNPNLSTLKNHRIVIKFSGIC